jgi:hypothetical protein
MSWVEVDARHLIQDASGGRCLLYWDSAGPDAGGLQLWLDDDGRVCRFQLSYAPLPRHGEYYVEWQGGESLRIGEVDSGEGLELGSPGHKMSPIVRSSERLALAVLARLVEYFEQSAAPLEPAHHQQIAAILQTPSS